MSPPDSHGGGYTPSRFLPRRATTDQVHKPKEIHGYECRYQPNSHQSPSSATKPHGGDYIPFSRIHQQTTNTNLQSLDRPTRVTTMPHLQYNDQKHGGDYVPSISRSAHRTATESLDSPTGERVLTSENTASWSGSDQRHGGDRMPSSTKHSSNSQSDVRRLLQYFKK
ncbi:hypothetical protein BDW62DRAFT_204058 [Aspergillus aurantiobrunneus]